VSKDEPERVKVDICTELREAAIQQVMAHEMRTGRQRRINSFVEGKAADEIERLRSLLSVSEKRAEEMIASEREECARAAENLGLQTGLVRAAPRIAAAIRARGRT
jgi:hypothetical protein